MSNQVQERAHGSSPIEHAFVHVHINHIGPAVDLIFGHANGVFKLSFFDQPGELFGSGHVGAFTHHDEWVVFSENERFISSVLRWPIVRLSLPRLDTFDGFPDGFDVRRSATATTSHNVHPTLGCKIAHETCHLGRGLVKLAHFIG